VKPAPGRRWGCDESMRGSIDAQAEGVWQEFKNGAPRGDDFDYLPSRASERSMSLASSPRKSRSQILKLPQGISSDEGIRAQIPQLELRNQNGFPINGHGILRVFPSLTVAVCSLP